MSISNWFKYPGTTININNTSFTISKEALEQYFVTANVSENFKEIHDYTIPDHGVSAETIFEIIFYGLHCGTYTEIEETVPREFWTALLDFCDIFLRNSWRLVRTLCRNQGNTFVINAFDFIKFLRGGNRKHDSWEDFEVLVEIIFNCLAGEHPKIWKRVNDTMTVSCKTVDTDAHTNGLTVRDRFILKFHVSDIQRTIWISFADKIGDINFIDYCISVMQDCLSDGRIFICDDGTYEIGKTTREPKKNAETELAGAALRAMMGIYVFDPNNWPKIE